MAENRSAAPDPLPAPPAGFDPISEETVTNLPALLGMRLVEWREGFAAVEYDLDQKASNRQGVAHGGAIATLIDTTAGYAAVFCPYPGRCRHALTLALDIQYLAGAKLEDAPLRAEARIVGGGASIAFIDTLATNRHGETVAKASGVFRLRSDSRSLWGAPRAVG